MKLETFLTITTIVLPILSGGIGFLWKSSIDKKRELLSHVNVERRAAYQIFVDMVIDLLTESKVKGGKNINTNNYLTMLHSFYKKNILFASPQVVESFSNYMQYIYHMDSQQKINAMEHMNMLTKVLRDMRLDLGLSNKSLGNNGEILIRAIIRDFDSLNLEYHAQNKLKH